LLGLRRNISCWAASRNNDVVEILFVLCILCWIATFFSETFVQRNSRRMANLTYCISVLAVNLQMLLFFRLIDLYLPPIRWRGILEAVNRNQLFIFLVANLGVGLINFSMDTIGTSDAMGLAVLTVYISVVSAVAFILDRNSITLKFW
jgi:hypothetical protein